MCTESLSPNAVALIAWQWMVDRAQTLWQTPWPLPTTAGIFILAQWIIALAAAVGTAILFARWCERKWPRHLRSGEIVASPVADESGLKVSSQNGQADWSPRIECSRRDLREQTGPMSPTPGII